MEHRIVHVCGTMGSGKTTLIKSFMGQLDYKPAHDVTGKRKAPWGYHDNDHGLFIVGSYEVATASGCDTIKDTSAAYDLVRRSWKEGFTVVYEGLFMMNHTRGLQLWRDTRAVNVLRLTTPLDVCRQGVVDRRLAVGNSEPLPERFEDGLRGNDVRATNYTFKMKQAGAPVFRVNRDDALAKLNELTGVR